MQIEEFYKRNTIVGIVGNSGSGKSTFINQFKQSSKVGIINFNIINSIKVIDQIEYYDRFYNYKIRELEGRREEIIKMLEIDDSILDNNIYELSESELAKVLIASVLLYNPETIVFDEMLDSFDNKTKEKILKLIIKLKKFFKKNIFIVTSNIDDIYEFIDDVIIIDDGKVLLKGKKTILLDNINILTEKNIRVPNIVYFINKMKEKGINLDNVDSVNELIKTIYREMR
ncbi:MAG: ATP-binding cassette domain-containing protein [Bacilli bacterium]|nr:ATP-binding cassette domain-containing protein [Bacilli bacterium]